MITLQALSQQIDRQLALVITDNLQRQAEINLILQTLCNISREYLITHGDEFISPEIQQKIETLLSKRVQERMPIQYLLGEATFYGLSFYVTPAVLIPRPETELLVEAALEIVKNIEAPTLLDIGTGSGCIPITLQKNNPNLKAIAIDISEDALAVAKRNADFHQCTIHFLKGSWFEPVADKTFDIITCNPPYIDRKDENTLTAEVLKEPAGALFSPDDPFDLYISLIHQAHAYLNPNGFLFLEMGMGQVEAIRDATKNAGYASVQVINDYAGIPRTLVCGNKLED